MSDTNGNDACKTYLEQTKLLVTLASAFIIAPIALFEKLQTMNSLVIFMELGFVLSVFTGYVVFGTISGTQHKGEYNVYNSNTMLFSRIQIGLFLFGLVFFLLSVTRAPVNEPEEVTSCEHVIHSCHDKTTCKKINSKTCKHLSRH